MHYDSRTCIPGRRRCLRRLCHSHLPLGLPRRVGRCACREGEGLSPRYGPLTKRSTIPQTVERYTMPLGTVAKFDLHGQIAGQIVPKPGGSMQLRACRDFYFFGPKIWTLTVANGAVQSD